MSIGSTIKSLRRARELTQEELAEYLGISPKAISQWETDRTSPDLSQIPLLCNLFNVTSDMLLGIDIASKLKKIQELYNAAFDVACTGDHKKSVEMWLDGIRQFPDSYMMMAQYVDEIFMYSHMLDDEETHIKRAFSYIDRILSDCTDSKIRYETISTACMWYPRVGKSEKATELAEAFPNYTRGDMLLYVKTGTGKHETWRDNIMMHFTRSVGALSDYARSKDDNGNDIYTDNEKIELCKKQIEMFRLFFDEDDYMFFSQWIEIAYRHLAEIYARKNDAENTINSLEGAANLSAVFDTYDYEATHDSLIARGNVSGGVWMHDEHNRSYDLLQDMLTDVAYEFVRGTERFQAIADKLRETAV